MKNEICQQISAGLGSFLQCAEVNGFTRIRTPFFYPDGTVIDLFVREQEGSLIVSDLGETNRWLEMHALSEKRTAKQLLLIEGVRSSLGVDIFGGAIEARANPDELAAAFSRVAQAAVRIGDISFTFRTRSAGTVTDDVEEYLVGRQIGHERNAIRFGESGKQWRLDFETTTDRRKSLIQVMSTANRGAVSRLTDHAVSAWVDLGPMLRSSHSFISIFDDTFDVWKQEDYKQLESVSVVALWSQPDSLMDHLAI